MKKKFSKFYCDMSEVFADINIEIFNCGDEKEYVRIITNGEKKFNAVLKKHGITDNSEVVR